MFDLQLTIGNVSIVLLVTGFLLFLVEVLLSISLEKDQLTLRNALVVILMYFIYSQMWVVLVLCSVYQELKRVLLKQEVKWYKTERFSPEQKKKLSIDQRQEKKLTIDQKQEKKLQEVDFYVKNNDDFRNKTRRH